MKGEDGNRKRWYTLAHKVRSRGCGLHRPKNVLARSQSTLSIAREVRSRCFVANNATRCFDGQKIVLKASGVKCPRCFVAKQRGHEDAAGVLALNILMTNKPPPASPNYQKPVIRGGIKIHPFLGGLKRSGWVLRVENTLLVIRYRAHSRGCGQSRLLRCACQGSSLMTNGRRTYGNNRIWNW
jgi:hypothetical protein